VEHTTHGSKKCNIFKFTLHISSLIHTFETDQPVKWPDTCWKFGRLGFESKSRSSLLSCLFTGRRGCE